jgi:hypothetical protein
MRRYQFRLRTLLTAVMAWGLALGGVAHLRRADPPAVTARAAVTVAAMGCATAAVGYLAVEARRGPRQ